MIRNYLLLGWRNARKHRLLSLIQLLGLSGGLAACLLIGIYIAHEKSYDQYNRHAGRIARVTTVLGMPDKQMAIARVATPLLPALLHYPEVEAIAGIRPLTATVSKNQQLYAEENFHYSDSSLFSVFDVNFIAGDRRALDRPDAIALSASTARKYFGSTAAVGQILTCNRKNYTITAVFDDRPVNSDITIDALLSGDFSKEKSWVEDMPYFCFVLFSQNTNSQAFARKITKDIAPLPLAELKSMGAINWNVSFEVEPLEKVHFSASKEMDTPKGNSTYLPVLGLLAVLILLIALANYVNFSITKSTERAREVGVRKAAGAPARMLIGQFMVESLVLICIAWLLAILLLAAVIPLVNHLLQIHIIFTVGSTAGYILAALAASLLLGGLYPAIVLARYQPAIVLKGSWKNSASGLLLRKSLLLFQCTIAGGLLFCTLIMYKQTRFLQHTDPGYRSADLLQIFVPNDSTHLSAIKAFREALAARSFTSAVSTSGIAYETQAFGSSILEKEEGGKMEVPIRFLAIDPAFLSAYAIPLVAGRAFSGSVAGDKGGAFMVNEALVRRMGWTHPVGMRSYDDKGNEQVLIGVVKDFHFESMHNKIEPLMMTYSDQQSPVITAQVQPGSLSAVKKIYEQYISDIPFRHQYVTDMVAEQYVPDRKAGSVFNAFTLLALFLACLGLYGMASLLLRQRTREIGIRKLLGAGQWQLARLLSGGFLQIVLLALVIGLPVCYFLMNRWLTGYAYHVHMQWTDFLLPATGMVLLTLAVTGKEVGRALDVNVAESIR